MKDRLRLATKLARAWRRTYGAEVQIADLHQLNAGASALTCVFDVIDGEHKTPCVVQLAGGGEQFVSALDKALQAQTQQAAFRAGVATPEVLLGLEADGDSAAGFVSRRLAGETLGKHIVHDPGFSRARAGLAVQCAQALAGIHALSTESLAMLPARDADTQLHELTERHRSYGASLPVFEAAVAYLRARTRPTARARCVVHGDFRMGNLLVDENGLSAVLDWELAHLGDPMEDLGWLCVRSWRYGRPDLAVGGFATRDALYEAYSAATRTDVDPEAVRYWEMLGTFKWGVICQWFAQRRLSRTIDGIEPAVIGRRVSEVELQLLDLLEESAS